MGQGRVPENELLVWNEKLTTLTRAGTRYSARQWVIDIKWKSSCSNQYFKAKNQWYEMAHGVNLVMAHGWNWKRLMSDI